MIRSLLVLGLLLAGSGAHALGCEFHVHTINNGEQGQQWQSIANSEGGDAIRYDGEYKAMDVTYKIWVNLDKSGRYSASIRSGDSLGQGLAFTMGNLPMKGGGGANLTYFTQGSRDIQEVTVVCGAFLDRNGN